jgi:hypothetical protein
MNSTIRQPTTTPSSKKLNKTSIVVQPFAAASAPAAKAAGAAITNSFKSGANREQRKTTLKV